MFERGFRTRRLQQKLGVLSLVAGDPDRRCAVARLRDERDRETRWAVRDATCGPLSTVTVVGDAAVVVGVVVDVGLATLLPALQAPSTTIAMRIPSRRTARVSRRGMSGL